MPQVQWARASVVTCVTPKMRILEDEFGQYKKMSKHILRYIVLKSGMQMNMV